MNAQSLLRLKGLSLSLFLMMALAVGAARAADATAADAADQAWEAFAQASKPPVVPAEWLTRVPTADELSKALAQNTKWAANAAAMARDFYTRFPTHPKVSEAREKELLLLEKAVDLGHEPSLALLQEREMERFKSPGLTEDERFQLLAKSVMRGPGRHERESAEWVAALAGAVERLRAEFPRREEVFALRLFLATRSEPEAARKLTRDLLKDNPPDAVRETAEALSRRLDFLGKSLALDFKSVDGSRVDIAAMRGKVVLVEFWATWCGPCMQEVPLIRAAHEKYHGKGLQVVGISFDNNQAALKRVVERERMNWPHYFDGAGWEGPMAKHYAIDAIPALWLVDKKGILRDINARDGLNGKIEKLLAE